jgi:hypothetical protein
MSPWVTKHVIICLNLTNSKDEIDALYTNILNNDKRYELEKIGVILVKYSEMANQI